MASTLGNYRKTVGIIGASRIGLKTIELLAPYDFELLLTSDQHYAGTGRGAGGGTGRTRRADGPLGRTCC